MNSSCIDTQLTENFKSVCVPVAKRLSRTNIYHPEEAENYKGDYLQAGEVDHEQCDNNQCQSAEHKKRIVKHRKMVVLA